MPFFPKGRRGVLFCAPIWNITRKRRRGGPLRPPVPRCGTFPHSSRRGGPLWPSVRSPPGGVYPSPRRGESQTRPSPVAGRSLIHPVGEGLAPPAGFRNCFGQRRGFRPVGRRAGSSRPTGVMVHKGRVTLCGRPSPVAGRFPCYPVGAALCGRPSPLHGNGLVRRTPDLAPSATAGRNEARR